MSNTIWVILDYSPYIRLIRLFRNIAFVVRVIHQEIDITIIFYSKFNLKNKSQLCYETGKSYIDWLRKMSQIFESSGFVTIIFHYNVRFRILIISKSDQNNILNIYSGPNRSLKWISTLRIDPLSFSQFTTYMTQSFRPIKTESLQSSISEHFLDLSIFLLFSLQRHVFCLL